MGPVLAMAYSMKPVFRGPLEKGTGILQSLSEPGGRFFHIVVLACCLAWMSLAGVLGFPRDLHLRDLRSLASLQPQGLRGWPSSPEVPRCLDFVADGSCAVQGAVPEELRNEERTRDSRKLPRHGRHSIEKSSDTVHAIASGHSSPSTLQTKYWEMGPVCGGQRKQFTPGFLSRVGAFHLTSFMKCF